MPLLNGYSKKTLDLNIAELAKSRPRNFAVLFAKNKAREAFFKNHPRGVLPYYLLLPGADQRKEAFEKWKGKK